MLALALVTTFVIDKCFSVNQDSSSIFNIPVFPQQNMLLKCIILLADKYHRTSVTLEIYCNCYLFLLYCSTCIFLMFEVMFKKINCVQCRMVLPLAFLFPFIIITENCGKTRGLN